MNTHTWEVLHFYRGVGGFIIVVECININCLNAVIIVHIHLVVVIPIVYAPSMGISDQNSRHVTYFSYVTPPQWLNLIQV